MSPVLQDWTPNQSDIYQLRHKANTGVFDTPLNITPGTAVYKQAFNSRKLLNPLAKSAGINLSGKINGQNGAETHRGIINVPLAFVIRACL